MDTERRLALAGFVATAVTYGPARMGFGLFLPVFRTEFALSSTEAGLIAAAAFAGQFTALGTARPLTARYGPRAAVSLGALLAVLGLAAVAAAGSTAMLAAGTVLAATSAGLSWSPYNDAADRAVRAERRADVLSVVSTGTTVGIGAAALLALALVVMGLGWRAAWSLFALAAAGALVLNVAALRGLGPTRATPPAVVGPRELWTTARPIAACAFAFGFTSAVFLSFAPDRIAAAEGFADAPTGTIPGLIFLAFAVAGFIGVTTGRLERRLGLGWLVRAIFASAAVSLALVAAAPAFWPAALAAAALQGASVMAASATLAFWSARLFPRGPTAGFTIVLLVYAAGSVLGPAVAGIALDGIGPAATFALVAALALATAAAVRTAAA